MMRESVGKDGGRTLIQPLRSTSRPPGVRELKVKSMYLYVAFPSAHGTVPVTLTTRMCMCVGVCRGFHV